MENLQNIPVSEPIMPNFRDMDMFMASQNSINNMTFKAIGGLEKRTNYLSSRVYGLERSNKFLKFSLLGLGLYVIFNNKKVREKVENVKNSVVNKCKKCDKFE